MKNEIEIKTERLVQMLVAENLGGVLLNSQANFAWATGGKSNVINSSAENNGGFLFVRADGKKFILANNIEMPRILAEEISANDFEPIEFAWQDEKSAGDYVFEKAKSLINNGKNIASDLLLDQNYRSIENLIAACRYELTEAEIARYRRLGADTGNVLESIFQTLNMGETEAEIARKVKYALAIYGIEAVVTLVGADERIANFRHPVATGNVWKKILLIAVCGRREGLIASLSRIVCVGEIPAELRRRTDAVVHVFANFLAATEQGANAAEIYQSAAKTYAANNFADEIGKHHQGGAIGYKTRDWVAHPQSAETVRNNQAFAWNPSITGTKAEETVIAGENGIEYLTASTNFPRIEIELDGNRYFAPDILSL